MVSSSSGWQGTPKTNEPVETFKGYNSGILRLNKDGKVLSNFKCSGTVTYPDGTTEVKNVAKDFVLNKSELKALVESQEDSTNFDWDVRASGWDGRDDLDCFVIKMDDDVLGGVIIPNGHQQPEGISFIPCEIQNITTNCIEPPTQLTTDPAGDVMPNWSPDGSKIVFYSRRDGNDEIYVMNADGTNQTRLTTDPAVDIDPTWSPDGTKIAFTSWRDGNYEIYVMNADGTNQTRLTTDPAGERLPAWSPDGTKIAFISNRAGNNIDIYVMNADGTNQTRLTTDPAWDVSPTWSPDGTKIAFTSWRDGNGEIYVMNADGTNQTRLTTDPAWDVSPAWSPDGSKIVFHSNRDGNDEIYVMNADGTGQTRLTNNPANDALPAWSPDGTKIAFSSDRAGNWDIWVGDIPLKAHSPGESAPTTLKSESEYLHKASTQVYTDNGTAYDLTIYLERSIEGRWSWWAVNPTRMLEWWSGCGILTFDPDGELIQAKSYTLESPSDSRTDLDRLSAITTTTSNKGFSGIVIDSLKITPNFEGLTQYSNDSTAQIIDQDGYPMGRLSKINIDEEGIIRGDYTNGIQKNLAQIVIATFENLGGLERSGSFKEGPNSGDMRITKPYIVGARIRSGCLESSNVDLSEEFLNMILAERGFMANSRIITQADRMIMELMRMRM
jgi:TolB protein